MSDGIKIKGVKSKNKTVQQIVEIMMTILVVFKENEVGNE